jgi:tRNA U34 2-thiouridine synthase MnmA/TrmU
MDLDIKVKRVICKCGKSRLHSVIDPVKGLSKSQIKSITKLVKLGLDVETITLEEARALELCFDCKL